MDTLVFNFLRYLLLFQIVVIGTDLAKRKVVSNTKYWTSVLPIILVYSFMEGCRWERGVDYVSYYALAEGRFESDDLFLDITAAVLRVIGLPPSFFFIILSGILIISLLRMVKDFRVAFIPCLLLMYVFSMQQSENLVSQWCATSLMLVCFCLFYEKRWFIFVIVAFLAFFSHKSILFVVPFLVVFHLIFNTLGKGRDSNITPAIFLLLYAISTTLQSYFQLSLQDLEVALSINNEGYLSDEYLRMALQEGESQKEMMAATYYLRSYIRNIVIIVLGFYAIKAEVFQNHQNKLYVAYGIACSSIIYIASLPDFQIEVIGRLNIYLAIFSYFIEGLVIYVFALSKTWKTLVIARWHTLMKLFVYLLLILDIMLIFKPIFPGEIGLKFIWSD